MKPVNEKKPAKTIDWDLRRNYRPEPVTLPVKGVFRKVAVQDLYAEAVSVSLSFRERLSRLPGDMSCRCHNSLVVNLKHVQKRTSRGLLLDTGAELPVSRTCQQEIAKQAAAFLQ